MNFAELEKELTRIEQLYREATRVRTMVRNGSITFVGDIDRAVMDPAKLSPPSGRRRAPSRFIRINPVIQLNLSEVDLTEKDVSSKFELITTPRQVGHLPPVRLMQIGASQHYELVEDYSYDFDFYSVRRRIDLSMLKKTSKGVPTLATVTARAGFQFDRSSIPRVFWVVISKDDLSNVPPLFHDLLYRFGGKLPETDVDPYTTFSRVEADHMFLHLMKRSGVADWRAQIAYHAVKLAGASSWHP